MKIFIENKSRLKVSIKAVYQKDLPGSDLVELKQRYGRPPALRRKFEAFLSLWKDSLKDKLLRPCAKVSLLDKEGFRKIVPSTFEDPFCLAAPGVWTIGSELEEFVSELMGKGQNVEALLLDALGTLVLAEVKKTVRELVTKEIASPLGLYVSEHYPTAKEQDLLGPSALVSLTNSEKSIGISCLKGGGLHPLKSGVSVFFLTKEAKKLSPSGERCDPCMEQKCPYFQIGGCAFKRASCFHKR